ncbi:UV DNA damage repair endonuclease UvsE [Clostridia bacterium]|nr:UV DNA damage repair endonuclease UvsE [Clostridia bacterium]
MSIGYACIITSRPDLRFSTCRLSNASKERLNEIMVGNVAVLDKMIDFNIKNQISLFRISSDVIPFATHPINGIDWQFKYAEQLTKIGLKIKKAGLRVSMHPGQYTVLNSPHQEVVSRAIADIHYHAEFLNALGLDYTHKIILHIGGAYGDKSLAQDRFINNVKYLDSSAKKRLVIENDEKIYSVRDVLNIGMKTGNPCIFDILHHNLNLPSEKKSIVNWIDLFCQTWQEMDGIQKIHYSQQDGSKRRGAHSRTIQHREFLDFYHSLNSPDIDIMLEVKDKEISAIKCINLLMHDASRDKLLQEWHRYRFLVMSRSKGVYDAINRKLVANSDLNMLEFYDFVEDALSKPIQSKQLQQAILSVWSSLEDGATAAEKKRFSLLLLKMNEDKQFKLKMIKWLFAVSLRQEKTDICESYLFLSEYLAIHQN